MTLYQSAADEEEGLFVLAAPLKISLISWMSEMGRRVENRR